MWTLSAMQRTLLAGSGCLSSSYPTSQKRGTCKATKRHPDSYNLEAQHKPALLK